ncbi:MAG: NUDIX domain-containing protein [Candidatus Aminicenantes bacterium]|nr:NUDIX domain-containing protein [Candidatus Aminicenantes bacterium]
MKKKSAGILLYRLKNKFFEVFLVHPGGPFWTKKDFGAWSIPKGEFTEDENPLDAAKREFQEELGINFTGELIPLTPIKQKSGKIVYAWASEGDIDPNQIKSNTFEIEWPPKSGKKQEFPEIDKGEWFNISDAKRKIIPSQLALIDELISKLNLTKEQLKTRDITAQKKDDSSQIDLF